VPVEQPFPAIAPQAPVAEAPQAPVAEAPQAPVAEAPQEPIAEAPQAPVAEAIIEPTGPIIHPFHIFLSAMINYCLSKTSGHDAVNVDCTALYNAYYHGFYKDLRNEPVHHVAWDVYFAANIRRSYEPAFVRTPSHARLEQLLSVQTPSNLNLLVLEDFGNACRKFYGSGIFRYTYFDAGQKAYFTFKPITLRNFMIHKANDEAYFYERDVILSAPLSFSVGPLEQPPAVFNPFLNKAAARRAPRRR
jgi:hypothetical protein